MSIFKRISLISFLSLFLFVFSISFVNSFADPLTTAVTSISLDDGGELLGAVLAPEVVIPIALTLVACGVAWQNRTELENVCSYIGNHVKGSYILSAGKCAVDIQSVVNAYNRMCKTHLVNSKPIHFSDFDAQLSTMPLAVPFYSDVMGCPVVIISRNAIGNNQYGAIGLPQYSDVCTTLDSTVNWSKFGFQNVHFYINDGGSSNILLSSTTAKQDLGYYGLIGQGSLLCNNSNIGLKYCPFITPQGYALDTWVALINPPQVAPSITAPQRDVNVTMPTVYNPVHVGSSYGTLDVPTDSSLVKSGVGSLVGTGYQTLDKAGELKGVMVGEGSTTIPLTQTGELTGEKTATGTATGEGTATGTATDSATLDFKPLEKIGYAFENVFPFCIPFNFVDSIKMLFVPPIAPNFQVHLHFAGIDGGVLHINLSRFNVWAEIVRFFVAFAFSIAVILKTRDLIRG